jgi:hypothetical protein
MILVNLVAAHGESVAFERDPLQQTMYRAETK